MNYSDIINQKSLSFIQEDELIKPRRLSLNNQFFEKFGALNLYMNLFIDWKCAIAEEKEYFHWGWGRLSFRSIMVFEFDSKKPCPIMVFEEFYALLQVAYINF